MRIYKIIFIFLISIILFLNLSNVFGMEEGNIPQIQEEEIEKWGALDEIVIEKFAKEKGKEPAPFIELEGDLILFIFSLFSGIAGFFIGYYSRAIFGEKK